MPGSDVIYHWKKGRGAVHLKSILSDKFTGTLQCDGYKASPSFQSGKSDSLTLAGCWAHVRRKFYQALERAPKIARWILRQIEQLYQIETQLKKSRAGPSLRSAIRMSQSVMILQRMENAFFCLKRRYLPQSQMGKAIAYALNQWDHLNVFLKNGNIEIDNNPIERAIRPTKLGAKNWLFMESETSGQNSAILYSLIESAKRHGLEPYAYIKELLHKLPESTNQQMGRLTLAAIARSKKLQVA